MNSTQFKKIFKKLSQVVLLEELTEENAYKTVKTSSTSYLAIQLVEVNSFYKVIRLISFVEADSQAKLDYEIEIRVWSNNLAEGLSLIQPNQGIDKHSYNQRHGLELPKKADQAEINHFLQHKLNHLATV